MKIAVIGGGTTGYIAASHISKHFPQFDLYHIFDSAMVEDSDEVSILTLLMKGGIARLFGRWTQPSFTEVGYGILSLRVSGSYIK